MLPPGGSLNSRASLKCPKGKIPSGLEHLVGIFSEDGSMEVLDHNAGANLNISLATKKELPPGKYYIEQCIASVSKGIELKIINTYYFEVK